MCNGCLPTARPRPTWMVAPSEGSWFIFLLCRLEERGAPYSLTFETPGYYRWMFYMCAPPYATGPTETSYADPFSGPRGSLDMCKVLQGEGGGPVPFSPVPSNWSLLQDARIFHGQMAPVTLSAQSSRSMVLDSEDAAVETRGARTLHQR